MAEQPLSEHALRAARTYGAAADHYGLPPLSFWDRFGAATVSRLRLAAGASALDLCCGAGASAIRSAHAGHERRSAPGGGYSPRLGGLVAMTTVAFSRPEWATRGISPSRPTASAARGAWRSLVSASR